MTINSDGVVDFNDAILVDNNNGNSYTNLNQQLAATQQAPITGTVVSLSLVSVQQVDGEAAIGATDVTELNTGLTGAGNTNWYGYGLTKTGPNTINFAPHKRNGDDLQAAPGPDRSPAAHWSPAGPSIPSPTTAAPPPTARTSASSTTPASRFPPVQRPSAH